MILPASYLLCTHSLLGLIWFCPPIYRTLLASLYSDLLLHNGKIIQTFSNYNPFCLFTMYFGSSKIIMTNKKQYLCIHI